MFRCGPSGPRFLVIYDAHGNWGFPKGHVEAGEDPAQAARREIAEEVGLNCLELRAPLGTIDWFFRAGGRLIHKYCHFFLFQSDQGAPVPQAEEGIQRCEWLSVEEALARLTYRNAQDLLRAAAGQAERWCGETGEPSCR